MQMEKTDRQIARTQLVTAMRKGQAAWRTLSGKPKQFVHARVRELLLHVPRRCARQADVKVERRPAEILVAERTGRRADGSRAKR
jgi:hypothetical protein